MKIYESFADIAERRPEAFFSESETTTRQQTKVRAEGSVRSESIQFILLHPVPVQGRIEFMSQFVRPLRRF